MLTLKEIYSNYQAPYYDSKKINLWITRKFYSKAATPIIKLLLYTSASANQVTIGWIIMGIFACCLLTIGNYAASMAGAFLIQLHIILDYVDGPIARIRGVSSLESKRGMYIERIGHDLIFTSFFYCISVGAVKAGHKPLVMLNLGFLASIGYFFYKYTRRAKIYCVLVSQAKENHDNGEKKIQQKLPVAEKDAKKNILRTLYRKVQPLWDPVPYTTIAFIAFLFDIGYVIPIFYGCTYPLHFIISYVYQAKINDGWVMDMVKRQNA